VDKLKLKEKEKEAEADIVGIRWATR